MGGVKEEKVINVGNGVGAPFSPAGRKYEPDIRTYCMWQPQTAQESSTLAGGLFDIRRASRGAPGSYRKPRRANIRRDRTAGAEKRWSSLIRTRTETCPTCIAARSP